MRSNLAKFLLVPVAAISVSACGINSVPTAEENAKAKWADVQAAFQERANLIPNLANVVKGAAAQENKTLTEVIEARSKATSVTLAPGDLNDPAKMAAFQTAQNNLSGSLSRLLVSVEQYPQLKSQEGFLKLRESFYKYWKPEDEYIATRVDELIAICFFVGCDRGMSCSVGLGWSHEPRLMGDASTELQQRGEVIERHPA